MLLKKSRAMIFLPILSLIFIACEENGRVKGGGSEKEQCFPPGSFEVAVIEWSTRIGVVAGILLCLMPFLFIFSAVIDNYLPGAGKFIRRHTATIAVGLATVTVSCYVLAKVAPHLWWIALVIVSVGLVVASYLFWINRRKVEEIYGIDLDGDGQVGAPKEPKTD